MLSDTNLSPFRSIYFLGLQFWFSSIFLDRAKIQVLLIIFFSSGECNLIPFLYKLKNCSIGINLCNWYHKYEININFNGNLSTYFFNSHPGNTRLICHQFNKRNLCKPSPCSFDKPSLQTWDSFKTTNPSIHQMVSSV